MTMRPGLAAERDELLERGDHCPYPRHADGFVHAVLDGVCATCGAHIRPILARHAGLSDDDEVTVWETHYRCVPRLGRVQ